MEKLNDKLLNSWVAIGLLAAFALLAWVLS